MTREITTREPVPRNWRPCPNGYNQTGLPGSVVFGTWPGGPE